MTITAALDIVRLMIGDTDSTATLLSDEEVNYFIGLRGTNYLLAAADCCDALATKYARAYDFQTDGQSFKRSQMAARYEAMAQMYRTRGNGITSVAVTRKDGYSTDVDNETPASASGEVDPRQKYYFVEGVDRLP